MHLVSYVAFVLSLFVLHASFLWHFMDILTDSFDSLTHLIASIPGIIESTKPYNIFAVSFFLCVQCSQCSPIHIVKDITNWKKPAHPLQEHITDFTQNIRTESCIVRHLSSN